MPWWSRKEVVPATTHATVVAGLTALVGQVLTAQQELMRTVVDMKREGYNPQPAGASQPLEPALDDLVEGAIRQRTAPGSLQEADARRWAAAELRREGATSAAVAALILTGGSVPDLDGEEELE